MSIIFLFDQKNGFPVSFPNLAKKTNVYRKNKVADNAVVSLLHKWTTRQMFIGKTKGAKLMLTHHVTKEESPKNLPDSLNPRSCPGL